MQENNLASVIPSLESFAEARPEMYRFRVGLLAALGYVYLLLIVSILLAVVAVTLFYVRLNWIAIKVLWIPLALVGLVLRSLWITIPEPDGMKLQREQAPALFDLIREVTTALNGPNFFRQSKDQPKTPSDPFVQMLGGLAQPIGRLNSQKWFFEELRVPTGYEDTHPALADRLAAIGFEKDGKEVATLIDSLLEADEESQSAESYYIKDLPEDFLPWLNRLWRERLAQTWRESHQEIKQAQERLDELNEQADTRPLTLDEQWERVTIAGRVKEPKDTLPLVGAILREQPDHAGANFAMGSILLEQKNVTGIQYLEKAMQLDRATTGEASLLLSGFYFDEGNKELAEEFRKRAEEHFEREQKQQEQALRFTENDHFIPHGLDEKDIKEIQTQLPKVRGLERAYLVRKVIDGSDASI